MEPVEDLIFNGDEKIIIAVGRLIELKDYTTLLKAFSIVSNSVKSRLVILGRGPLESKLRELSEELGISKSVIFLGFKKIHTNI